MTLREESFLTSVISLHVYQYHRDPFFTHKGRDENEIKTRRNCTHISNRQIRAISEKYNQPQSVQVRTLLCNPCVSLMQTAELQYDYYIDKPEHKMAQSLQKVSLNPYM